MAQSYEEGLTAFLVEAKAAYEQMFKSERQGELKTFSQRELCVYEEGRRLSRALLAEHLARNVQDGASAAEKAACPKCQRLCSAANGASEIRPVSTLVGDISFSRARYYCKRCRKSFFPSGP